MNGVLVAFASSDRVAVDEHFGSATGLVVYKLDEHGFELNRFVQFEEAPQDGNEDKLKDRIAALEDCNAVYVRAIGGSAIRQLVQRGIHPVKVAPSALIKQLIGSIQTQMAQGAQLQGDHDWLSRACAPEKSADRFSYMEAEGWDE